MTSNISPRILKLASWLQDKCDTYKFGTFEIGVSVHAGNITKVTYSAAETVKPNDRSENGEVDFEKFTY